MVLQSGNWIYLTPRDPIWYGREVTSGESARQEAVRNTVRKAIGELSEMEKMVIEMYYFEGASLAEIARKSAKSPSRINNIHRRALKRLRKLLGEFAHETFGVQIERGNCPLCRAAERAEIDRLIIARTPQEPYRVLMRRLRQTYGIKITSPQTIIGHIKYHG